MLRQLGDAEHEVGLSSLLPRHTLLAFFRLVVVKTRNGHDWTARSPAIAAGAERLPVRSAVIDGEAVILDDTYALRCNVSTKAASPERGS